MREDIPDNTHECRRLAIESELADRLRLQVEDAGELLLVRHAEAAPSQGSDPMLSCLGLRQAELLATRLTDTWFEAVYTAPERRAQQTARVLAGAGSHPVHVLDALGDIDFDAAHQPAESLSTYAERFIEVPRWDSLPGFECSKQFRRRAVQAIERILALHGARRVVLVTHASVINAYLSMLLTIPADLFFAAEPTSVSIVRWRDGQYALRSLNDLSHLSPVEGVSVETELLTLR